MTDEGKARKRERDRVRYWRHRDRLTEDRHKRQEENYEEYMAQKRARDRTWRQRHRDRLVEKRVTRSIKWR